MAKQSKTGEKNSGNSAGDARFCYAEEFLNASYGTPISISLPLRSEAFSPEQTRIFFEGLLPEGFTRRTVAGWLHVDENDYISILGALGQECLGAIKIVDNDTVAVKPGYEKLTLSQVKALAREGAGKSAELVTKAHLMGEKLTHYSVPFEVHIFDEGVHGMSLGTKQSIEDPLYNNDNVSIWVGMAQKFLKRHL